MVVPNLPQAFAFLARHRKHGNTETQKQQ
jgi:hypothetical protein